MREHVAGQRVDRPGKIHRLDPAPQSTATVCGIEPRAGIPWAWWSPVDAVPVDACRRCWTEKPEPTVDEAVAQLIDTEVARAVDCYRHHMPGHGEYVLVRLGMRLARLERVVAEARDALAD